jgi:hypothetical protein
MRMSAAAKECSARIHNQAFSSLVSVDSAWITGKPESVLVLLHCLCVDNGKEEYVLVDRWIDAEIAGFCSNLFVAIHNKNIIAKYAAS